MPPRKRTVTARRTTTEEVTVTDEEPWAEPVHWAPGDPAVRPDEPRWHPQRIQQVLRVRDLLSALADDGHTALDRGTLAQAVTMLRALPGSSCMEAEHGRTL